MAHRPVWVFEQFVCSCALKGSSDVFLYFGLHIEFAKALNTNLLKARDVCICSFVCGLMTLTIAQIDVSSIDWLIDWWVKSEVRGMWKASCCSKDTVLAYTGGGPTQKDGSVRSGSAPSLNLEFPKLDARAFIKTLCGVFWSQVCSVDVSCFPDRKWPRYCNYSLCYHLSDNSKVIYSQWTDRTLAVCRDVWC